MRISCLGKMNIVCGRLFLVVRLFGDLVDMRLFLCITLYFYTLLLDEKVVVSEDG